MYMIEKVSHHHLFKPGKISEEEVKVGQKSDGAMHDKKPHSIPSSAIYMLNAKIIMIFHTIQFYTI